MTTLSDISSPEAQDGLQRLLNLLFGIAQQYLAKYSEFFPFAAAVGADGEERMIAAVPDPTNDRPPSADVIDACHEALISTKETIRSGGIASDVRLLPPSEGDALRLDFEHVDGTALVALLSYLQKRGGEIDYGELSIMVGRSRVWA
jgi:hypothetical protein